MAPRLPGLPLVAPPPPLQPSKRPSQTLRSYNTPLASLPGGVDLRERACSISLRRHTIIQVQLAAAHINTSVKRSTDARETHESLTRVWEDYVKTCADKRRLTDSKGRKKVALSKQLDKLGAYLRGNEPVIARRNSLLPPARPPPSLRQSEVRKFEVLRKTARPAPPAGAAIAPAPANNTATPPQAAGLHRRRGGVSAAAVSSMLAKRLSDCEE